jgi:HK97 family phage portal protein
MSFLDRFFRREARAESVRSDDPQGLAEFFGIRSTGAAVNADAVLSNLAVAARCVGIRSEMLASVGLFVFRRTADGGRERAADLPLYGVLHDMWNPNLTAFEGREMMIRSLDTAGNAFARIERNARGQVVALWPEPWSNVAVEKLASGRLRYRVSSPAGGVTVLLPEEALHVRGPSRDGILGQSPIQIARGALGLALSQSQTALSFADNMLRPSGILTFAEKVGREARGTVSAALDEFRGATNAGKVMIMDGGAKFERMTFSPDDAEFLDSRKLANEDVARIYGVPPTAVGITDKATYSNTEQEARALVQNALGPLAARIEAAMARNLLTEAGRRVHYIEHDLSALLRGDVQARFEAYRIGREIGAFSANDIRRRENEPPIPGGDTYHQPANWVPLGSQSAPTGV